MIGDQQSATLGLQVLPQNVKVTYGTGCFMMKNTGPAVEFKEGLLSTVNLQLGAGEAPVYGLESAVESGAAVLNFFRDELGLIEPFEAGDAKLLSLIQNKALFFHGNKALQGDAPEAPRGVEQDIFAGQTLLVPSLNSTLFSPFWKSGVQGELSGLSFSAGPTQIYAAGLESFCFRIKQCLDVMDLAPATDIIIDGGVSQNEYLAHFQANLLRKDLQRIADVDGTMRGVFLGCLAFLNRKAFARVMQRGLSGTLIRATPDKSVQQILRGKFARFDQRVRALVQTEHK